MSKITMICAKCGGTNVMRDAWAVWDEHEQQWVLGSAFDSARCDDCDEETTIEECRDGQES